MLGFSGGSYYQYRRMAPYVRQEYNLINRNWKLATELMKVESILTGMSNLQVFEERNQVESWEYTLRQGSVECYYNPASVTTAVNTDNDYLLGEENIQLKESVQQEETKEE